MDSKRHPSVDDELIRTLRVARTLVLFLDYDGTLVPFVDHPDLAVPSDALGALLRSLAARHAVYVVSGRERGSLDRWLGDLPLGLCAEHGLWVRDPDGPWRLHGPLELGWMEPAHEQMQCHVERAPGAFVEQRTASLVFHYRCASGDTGTAEADALWTALAPFEDRWPVERLRAEMAVELRIRDVDKGQVVRRVLSGSEPDAVPVAIGDDRTDEDMFRAMPVHGVTIHVGDGPSCAGYRVGSPQDVVWFLRSLVEP